MFHVFQVVSVSFSRNSSKFQNLHREVAQNFPMSLRLHTELEPIWLESSEFFFVPEHNYTIYDDSHFQVPDPILGVMFRISFSPTTYMGVTLGFLQVPELIWGGA